jgi:hypothetical protein
MNSGVNINIHASEGGGDFADFNDITTPHSGMLSVQECSWQDTTKSFITYSSPFVGGSIGSEEAQERRMARAKMPWWAKTRARTAEREVLMLEDLPEEVKEGDEVFKLFLNGFGKRVEVVEVKFPGADSTWNAHRLAWWVYTNPAQNGDPGFSARTLEEQAARRRRRRSRRQSQSSASAGLYPAATATATMAVGATAATAGMVSGDNSRCMGHADFGRSELFYCSRC